MGGRGEGGGGGGREVEVRVREAETEEEEERESYLLPVLYTQELLLSFFLGESEKNK